MARPSGLIFPFFVSLDPALAFALGLLACTGARSGGLLPTAKATRPQRLYELARQLTPPGSLHHPPLPRYSGACAWQETGGVSAGLDGVATEVGGGSEGTDRT